MLNLNDQFLITALHKREHTVNACADNAIADMH